MAFIVRIFGLFSIVVGFLILCIDILVGLALIIFGFILGSVGNEIDRSARDAKINRKLDRIAKANDFEPEDMRDNDSQIMRDQLRAALQKRAKQADKESQ